MSLWCLQALRPAWQLKAALADVVELGEKDDRYFLRWLRARKFDLAKSEDMLRKASLNSNTHSHDIVSEESELKA